MNVTKQRSKGLGNASFLYQIGRTNGDAVKGSYQREELEVVPTMQDTWVGAPSKGRRYIDELRADGTISKWDEWHNHPMRDGSTWVEGEVDKLPEGSYKGLRREQVLWRLEQYLKQGMSKPNALIRLRDSLRSDGGPTNPAKLAILALRGQAAH